MKPFSRVPQPKEVESITWKREKQKRNLFTCSSCLLPSAKTSSQMLRRVLLRHPPARPAGSGGCRGTGTRGGSAGGAHAGPPAHATGDFSAVAAPPPRRTHRGEVAGSPRPGARRERERQRGATSARPLGSSASRPLSTRFSLSMAPHPARPAGRRALPCPSLPGSSLPPQGLPAPAGTAPTCAPQVGEGRRGGAQAAGGCSPDMDGSYLLAAISNPLLGSSKTHFIVREVSF